MKNYRLILILMVFFFNSVQATEKTTKNSVSNSVADNYETSVTFPAGFSVGDYIEFVGVQPISAGASGFYEISISYTRGSIAAAATYIAAISHANPAIWREVGCTNRNKYVDLQQNFTIDCNTQQGNPRLRVRAINTYGSVDAPLTVYIKIRSINFNDTFTPLSVTGNDLTVNKFLPMTNEWELYVGNIRDSENGASIAIKALANGNVGIGTTNPQDKLTVAGNIGAREIKVSTHAGADFVFEPTFKLPDLSDLEKFVKTNKHLPEIPTAKQMVENGVNLGELNIKLLQKVEELTLHLIEKDKQLNVQGRQVTKLETKLAQQDKVLQEILKKLK
ncbi:hypothetical protein QF042_001872 [Pedobacter sp. W3I1]|uniref:hypothetical protein n=1 Tax=Pedobacter sp. W3I1 TaxID=3042291 RepID=UPI00278282DC|nr:hypothetical protein [Pedobacter sp. W3I1]MDQ0638307.1 hypothetical protein [Pedobacter sp. W3I1]